MIGLALFIDAVGLEVFLMLLEIQLVAMLGGLLNSKVKPLFVYLKYLGAQNGLLFSWGMIKKEPEYLKLLVPGQAVLMVMLVLSSAISIAFNTC